MESLEELLAFVYPPEVLNSSLDDYRPGKYTKSFHPDKRLMSRINSPSLDLLLQVILSEGRLMETNNKDYYLYASDDKGIYHGFMLDEDGAFDRWESPNLERLLKLIFDLGFTSVREKKFDTIDENVRPSLECILRVRQEKIQELKDYLMGIVSYTDVGSKVLSFWPFNYVESKDIILTEYGLYFFGQTELVENVNSGVIVTSYRGRDIDLCLASESYNIDMYVDEENF